MKSLLFPLAVFGLITAPAFAQEGAPTTQCWEVLAPPQAIAPASALKINKCTGETWLLVRTRLSDAKAPDVDGTYTFRWRRLMQDDTGEAVLASRAGPP